MSNTQDYTEQEREALSLYKQNDPKDLAYPSAFLLNIFLRSGASLPDSLGFLAGNLLRAFSKPYARINEEKTFYRAANWNEIERHITGDHYTEHGFMSTSFERSVTHGFFEAPKPGYVPAAIEIVCPINTPVLFFNENGIENDDLEFEGLLCFSSRFRIEIEDVTDNNQIDMLVGRFPGDRHRLVKKVKLIYLSNSRLD